MPISRRSITAQVWPETYWSLPGARLYLGDVRKCLARLPSRSVHCAVTSPPYWGLWDYGVCICTATGADNSGCRLCGGTGRTISKEVQIGTESSPDCHTYGQAQCGSCFVCSMVDTFRELKRVLRDDGVLWLNLGDSYSLGGNLIGTPWRVALALQADGWVLRQDVIWSKLDPMPESVTNRCSKSHEYIFMLTKSDSYYFDQVAIERKGLTPAKTRTTINSSSCRQTFGLTGKVPTGGNGIPGKVWHTGTTGNEYSVWRIPTGNSGSEGHFATFGKELVTPCILSSTSEYGCCAMCATPWERVVIKNGDTRETIGWRKTCGCRTDEVKPCVVLDPFVGSGTTVVTAINLWHHGVGIDVCQPYLDEHAIPRIRACILGGSSVRKQHLSVVTSPSRPPDTGTVSGI